jgi:hypothetical protein
MDRCHSSIVRPCLPARTCCIHMQRLMRSKKTLNHTRTVWAQPAPSWLREANFLICLLFRLKSSSSVPLQRTVWWGLNLPKASVFCVLRKGLLSNISCKRLSLKWIYGMCAQRSESNRCHTFHYRVRSDQVAEDVKSDYEAKWWQCCRTVCFSSKLTCMLRMRDVSSG